MNITNKSFSNYFFTILRYVITIIFCLIIIAPIAVIFLGSFKTNNELLTTGVLSPPENWFNFENYKTAWVNGKMLLGFFNTFLILFA